MLLVWQPRAISITANASYGGMPNAMLNGNGAAGFGAALTGPEAAAQLHHLLGMQVAAFASVCQSDISRRCQSLGSQWSLCILIVSS